MRFSSSLQAEAHERTQSLTSDSSIESSVSDSEWEQAASVADDGTSGAVCRGDLTTQAHPMQVAFGNCVGACTSNVKALAVSFFLFSLITCLQSFAAYVARSRALMVDCISMGVDSFTYLGNMFIECKDRTTNKHVTSQLIVVAASLGLLCFFTVRALIESWTTIQACRDPEEFLQLDKEEDVNGWITLAFAIVGVVIDLVCMKELWAVNEAQACEEVNVLSIFLHVGADFLRSTSTVVMSLVILLCRVNTTCVDAYTSVAIGATILVGAFVGFWKWANMLFGCAFSVGATAESAPEGPSQTMLAAL